MLIRINLDGSYGENHIPILRANSKYQHIITVESPFPLTNVIEVTYSVRGSNERVSHFLYAKGVEGKNLWEDYIHQKALGLIGKYRAGLVLMSFSIKEPQIPKYATNYIGKTNDEPVSVGNDGDFYTTPEGFVWYYLNGSWHFSNYLKVITTSSIEVPVDPNIEVETEEIETDDIKFAALAGRVAVNEVEIQDHEQRIVENETNKLDKRGDTMSGTLGMGGNPIKDVDDAVDPQDAVTKKQLDVVVDETIRLDTIKADKATTYTITETNNLLAGKLDVEHDGSAKVDMPASIKNRNVVNVGYLIQEIFNESIIVDGKLLLKVDKLTQIAGLPIGDGITMNALVNQLRTATDNDKGLMSAVDKGRLDTLYQILTDNEESWVDTIHEILEILENYPEGTNLAGVLHDLRQDITALETANFLRKLNGIEPDQDGFIVINSTHIDNLSSIAAIDNKKINTVLDILWNKFDNYYLKGETYSTQEIDNLLDQLKAVYGWTDTHIGDFVANSDSFSNMLDYDYLILSASVSGEYLSRLVNTATIKPNDTFILDGLTLTATSNDNGTLTFTSGTGTVSLYGVKMEQQKSENITYEDTNVKDELDRIRGVGEYQLIRDTNGDVVEITDGINKTEIIRDSDKRVIEIEETFGTEKYKTTIEKNENGNVVKIKKEKVN